jgi:mono/diheme cytochrome c family protein
MSLRIIALLFLLAQASYAESAPDLLSQTGLYSDLTTKEVAAENLPFSPQYPLWSDGAKKSRWIFLPAGSTIDTGDMNNWVFPIGTKVWKEFRFNTPDGQGTKRVETRYLEKAADGSWIVATYAWDDAESDATRAPAAGIPDAYPSSPTTTHDIPSTSQCIFCHTRRGDKLLGFDALQLSDDRDTMAPHADATSPLTLKTLVDKKIIAPTPFVENPPKVHARTPEGRAAMGYMHGNCGGCHGAGGRASGTGQFLRHDIYGNEEADEPAFATTVNKLTRQFQLPNHTRSYRILAGDPDESAIHYRMSVTGRSKMPPVARKQVDEDALQLLGTWIRSLSSGR